MKKKKTGIVFICMLLLAIMTITSTYAASVPHNGSYKARYAWVYGKDMYYGRQAMDGEFSGNKNGLTMMYIKNSSGDILASGSVHYTQQDKHISTVYSYAESHSHTCTDNLI
ncbi:hypothetical protein [Thomasclavelia sp.]|uniref:hypothetical protein n=1 Tax=Thomasclavelia sp. TaxID=3025757 RepID=UPI0025D03BF9|nr:hypothetical protein [Thomasclavelia sp.]